MKGQLFIVLALAMLGVSSGQDISEQCVAASQAYQASVDSCFGGNITEFTFLVGQLQAAAGNFNASAPVIAANKAAFDNLLSQFCEQTCINVYSNFLKECTLPSLDEQTAKIITASSKIFTDLACTKYQDNFCLIEVASNSALLGPALACGLTNCSDNSTCTTTLNMVKTTLGCCYNNYYTVLTEIFNALGLGDSLLAPFSTVYESCGLTEPSACEAILCDPFSENCGNGGGNGALSQGTFSVTLTIVAAVIGQFLVK